MTDSIRVRTVPFPHHQTVAHKAGMLWKADIRD